MSMVYPVQLLDGFEPLVGHTLRVALLNSSHVEDETDTVWADVSANEVSGTGYTAGGQALTGVAAAQSAGVNIVYLDANDVVWSGATITARYAVIYDVSNGNQLVCSIDFGEDKTSTAGDFTIQWSSTYRICYINYGA